MDAFKVRYRGADSRLHSVVVLAGSFDEVRKKFQNAYGERLINITWLAMYKGEEGMTSER